jgi:DUF1680 family protein
MGGGPLRTPDDSPQSTALTPGITPGGGPVIPTPSAIAAQHPLPAPGARLTGGLLYRWQRRNADASMPLALHQLVAAGNLDNLELAIRAAGAPPEAEAEGDSPSPSPPAAQSVGPAASAADGAAVPPGGAALPQGRPTRPARRRRAEGVTPHRDLGYHGPVFMDSDIYKTLEAIGWELEPAPGQAPAPSGRSPRGQAVAGFAASAVALLARVQRPDGYLNSYIQASGEPRYANLASSHEMYCAGHLIQAAVGLARGAGDPSAMDIAVRLADHLVKEFAGQRKGLEGHPVIETAMVELYRETGTAAYRDLASQFVEQRGHGLVGDSGMGRRYLQDHLAVRQRTTEVGHAVRALYLEAGVTDVATETNDRELLDGSVGRWRDMVGALTYLTGGNGSRHNDEAFGDRFELPPDRAYNETCAAIASFQWSWRLLLATGDAAYADHMERILYNGFAAAISTEGNRFFYVNPLQRRVDHYEKDDPGRRREWFKTACCPPNIMRLLASLQHYLATTADGTLCLHQYATASVTGAGLTVEIDTDYPWDGRVAIRVTSAPDSEEREIAMRVPAWSATADITVNDSPEPVRAPAPSYLRVRRAWRPGDEVRLRLDMTPRLTYPDRRVDAVRGCAAIERGPLVYCFEQADQAARLDELAVIPAAPLTERTVTLPGIGRTIQVTVPALRMTPGSAAASREAPGAPDKSAAPVSAAARPGPAASSAQAARPDLLGTVPGRAAPPAPAAPGQQVVTAVAIPYFQWDNRGPGAMRVWIPAAGPASQV